MDAVIRSVLFTKHQLAELKELFKHSDVDNITYTENNRSLGVSYRGGQYDYDGIQRTKIIYPHKTIQLR